jgi:predicted nucleotide-binding protein
VAKINPDLIERLQKKLGIGPRAVYNRINKTSRQHHAARRDLAALLLAWELGISIQKYADAEQLNRLDRVTGGDRPLTPTPVPTTTRRSNFRRAKSGKGKKTKGNSVFVVHGRDEALRKSMFEFLRSLGLNPMEWGHAVETAKGANPYIGDILESAMDRVQAVVVLFSPDEMAYLKEQFWGPDDKHGDGKPAGQARPNVLFEAGLALGAHPEKTVIVQVGKVRPFSDIAGKHLIRLSQDKGRNDLANRLEKIGCDVNRIGDDWMTVGKFEPTEPKIRKAKKPAGQKRSYPKITISRRPYRSYLFKN